MTRRTRGTPIPPLLLALAACAAAGCARAPHPADWVEVHEITPAFLIGAAAQDPAVASDAHGRVALTWVSRDRAGHGLDLWIAVSSDSGRRFGPALRLNPDAGRVSSFPESRPVPAWGPGGRLAVAWSELRADSGMAADLMVRASADAGVAWGAPAIVNDDTDGRAGFHGFPALAFLPSGALFVAWMDGRDHAPEEAETSGSLYTSVSSDGGALWSPNLRVTDRLCPCCRTAALALSEDRVTLAYRTALHGQRDPVMAFSADGGRSFTAEAPLSPDGWSIEACPSDGPALAGDGSAGASAWYTGAPPAGVYLAPWEFNRGAAGLRRAIGDSLERAAHPRLAGFGSATLVGVEALPRGDSVAVLAVRALGPDGTLTPWAFLGAHAGTGWLASQPPRAALACWTERDRGHGRVRLVRLMARDRRR